MKIGQSALAVLFAMVAGCATVGWQPLPDRTYRNSYAFYDLKISWETIRDNTAVTISGILKNQSYYYLREPELTATLLDAEGNFVADGTFFFFPNQLALDETAPFTIRIPLGQEQALDRIQFTYRYRLAEEGRHGSPRFHSFEAKP